VLSEEQFSVAVNRTVQEVHKKYPIPSPVISRVLAALVDRPEILHALLGDTTAMDLFMANEGMGKSLVAINDALDLSPSAPAWKAVGRILEWKRERSKRSE
jgi:hypothetical protein